MVRISGTHFPHWGRQSRQRNRRATAATPLSANSLTWLSETPLQLHRYMIDRSCEWVSVAYRTGPSESMRLTVVRSRFPGSALVRFAKTYGRPAVRDAAAGAYFG